ncbi:hypothetical protein BJF79_32775 [Actinomadura sp. CNU-125]|uniref:hypothetical protein n=1 Tax=Actinomadura sp. CNU-125 TaxID=1904961 RepID=UPI00096153B9|nr:hypothetical protein [Actinomadura sp. CNU-125]OLT34919.1 hypothetical protein BJF79_32775 [Actinomadura sp. CNU-125]
MEIDTDGDDRERFWRRRVLALGGVLGAVAVLAWGCVRGTADEPVARTVAEAATQAPPPTAMPTVTVTVTTTPEPGEDGAACAEDDVVVTLDGAQRTYAKGAKPTFRVMVVNTAENTCEFDAGSLDLRITSGDDRIWSSAECRDGGAGKESLRRGVPYVREVVWDRRRGCDGKGARAGTYVADLHDRKGERQVFRLR